MPDPFIAMDPTAAALVRRVIPFASKDKGRPILTCVAFDRDAVVATDSYRVGIGWVDEPELPQGIVPAGWLDTIVHDRRDWIVESRDELPMAGLDSFPSWRSLLDKFRWTTRVRVRRSALLEFTKNRVCKIPAHKGTRHRDIHRTIRIEFTDGQVVLHGRAGRLFDEAVISAPIEASYDGPIPSRPLTVNAEFFRDALNASTLDVFAFEVDDQENPYTPKGIGNPVSIREPGFSQLLMPVRTW